MHLRFNDTGDLLIVIDATGIELKQLTNIASAKPAPSFIRGKWTKPDWAICNFFNSKFLPAGLFKRIIDLKKTGWDVKIDGWENLIDPGIKKDDIDKRTEALDIPFLPHYYQKQSIYLNRKYKKISQVIGTGGGKTFIFYCSVRDILDHDADKYKNKFLAIVPSQLLVDQMALDVKGYQLDNEKVKVYKIHSAAYNDVGIDDCNIVCMTFQSLKSMPDSFFSKFTGLFVDEDHRSKVYAIQKAIEKLRGVKWKWGMTGSAPDIHGLDMLNIESFIGACLFSHPVWQMVKDGDVSDFDIHRLEIHHGGDATVAFFDALRRDPSLQEPGRLRLFEEEYIFSNKKRNETLSKIARGLDGNMIILSKRVKQVLANYECMLENTDPEKTNVHKVHGSVKLSERNDILAQVRACSKNNIIAANVDCLGTGISIDTLTYGIFDGVGKSMYTTMQAIGRMLRKHESKKRAFIIDVCDVLHANDKTGINSRYPGNNYSARHQKARLKIYKDNKFVISKKTMSIKI